MNGSSQSISKIAVALLAAQKTMGDATKGSTNPFFRSSYADLNAIREVVTPSLNSQGIVVLQPTTILEGKNYVETILLHESGEFISGFTEIKNTDGKPQSEGSGISYARRYGLQSMLNVGAVDDDGEAAQGRAIKGAKSEQSAAQTKPKASPAAAEASAAPVSSPAALPSESKTPFTDSKVAREKIRSLLAVLEAQKKITKSEFAIEFLGSPKEKVDKFDAAGLTAAIDKKISGLQDPSTVLILGKLESKLNAKGASK
jgi:hypothetical protein